MPRRFDRPIHEDVVSRLGKFDSKFLADCGCYFGGGTRIVLELGEYRESRDIDFLCATVGGYRALRETVMSDSLGNIAAKRIELDREVRSDQYGIRTIIGGAPALKFEIIREARIALEGCKVSGIPVVCLDRAGCFAEKFLANADRGLDRSAQSRDAIDLAFMISEWPEDDAVRGFDVAETAYGLDISRKIKSAVEMLQDRNYRSRCLDGLAVSRSATLARGLKRLLAFSIAMDERRKTVPRASSPRRPR